jgi:hypothetical protein
MLKRLKGFGLVEQKSGVWSTTQQGQIRHGTVTKLGAVRIAPSYRRRSFASAWKRLSRRPDAGDRLDPVVERPDDL